MSLAELSEQEIIRRNSLNELRAMGIEPYPAAEYVTNAFSTDIKAEFKDDAEPRKVSVAGRIMSRRVMGKASFIELQDSKGRIQVYITRDDICPDENKDLYNVVFKRLLDLGDFALLHAHQHTLIGNVFAPGQLIIHADVRRQHTDRAADLAEPQIRLGDARDDTRQRRFAGAVQPRQPDDFAAVEVLRHAAERRKFLHVRPKTQQRLQAVFFLAVQVVDLRQFPAADDYIRQAHRPLSARFLPIKWR